MEKLETKIAEKLFNDVEAQYEECYSVTYGASKTPVKIYKNISMSDLSAIVGFVLDTAFTSGAYDHVMREVAVATAVVKYLTSIPTKSAHVDEEDGEIVDDFETYFQIVFGNNGLYDRRKDSYWIINKIEHYIDKALEFKKEDFTPLGRLCNRLSEIGKMLDVELNEFLNDPINVEKFENILSMASAQTTNMTN